MKYILLFCITLFLFTGSFCKKVPDKNVSHNKSNDLRTILNDSLLLLAWNKATVVSLKTSVNSARSIIIKNKYIDRLEMMSMPETRTPSLRKGFLEQITNIKDHFYIIEADHSGEEVIIINYLINIDEKGKFFAKVYNYRDKWRINDTIRKLNFHIQKNLRTYAVPMYMGFNENDVIITEFNYGKVIASEYYIRSTLANAVELKKILAPQLLSSAE